MKRNLIGILSLVVLSLVLNATGAFAQSDVKANVPFGFKVGTAQLPAGTYAIRTNNPNWIMIQNSRTTASAMSVASREYPRNGSPRLVFRHVGNQYFLTHIWRGSGNTGLSLPTSSLEKELRMASNSGDAGEEVVIALN